MHHIKHKPQITVIDFVITAWAIMLQPFATRGRHAAYA
jgi:hypothetical protein